MGHLSRSLASLIHNLREPQSELSTLENRRDDPPGELETLEYHEAQQPPRSTFSSTQNAAHAPTRSEVLNYLGRLADDYHLPRKLVYAVADAESSVNAGIPPQPNYVTKHGKKRIGSWDYGLMQLNACPPTAKTETFC